ncbi:TPA: hypothetical protein UM046_004464 [Stenotrophomonas maltophilia]|nr:hypothetical protein [Stenotrophomonas maltophilia]HEL3786643.1 hypothetical protein [Stenotrophomonas maltophilia]
MQLDWLGERMMSQMPSEAVVIIATGFVTVVSSVIAQICVSVAESRKMSREHARELQKLQLAQGQAARDVKNSKLAELWAGMELVRIRCVDGHINSRVGDAILPPPADGLASKPASDVYGIALLHFPELRPQAYELHAITAELETEMWFGGSDENIDVLLDRLAEVRTSLADGIEKIASSLAQPANQRPLR